MLCVNMYVLAKGFNFPQTPLKRSVSMTNSQFSLIKYFNQVEYDKVELHSFVFLSPSYFCRVDVSVACCSHNSLKLGRITVDTVIKCFVSQMFFLLFLFFV